MGNNWASNYKITNTIVETYVEEPSLAAAAYSICRKFEQVYLFTSILGFFKVYNWIRIFLKSLTENEFSGNGSLRNALSWRPEITSQFSKKLNDYWMNYKLSTVQSNGLFPQWRIILDNVCSHVAPTVSVVKGHPIVGKV